MNVEKVVVGLGTVLIDHVVVLPSHPERDTKQAVLDDHLQVGGPVPTALAVLRRLSRRCHFIGTWGNDPYGQMISEDFQAEGIATEFSRRHAGRTGFAHVWVCQESARRTIAYHRSSEFVTPQELDAAMFAKANVLHLDGWPGETALAAARLARSHRCTVVLDAGSPKPGMSELIRYVDVINVPLRSLVPLTGYSDITAGIQELLSKGPRIVTVTDGANGGTIGTAAGIVQRAAFPVHAVDTTGAGDVFCGALIHGLLEQWAPLRMLEFAMACAALKCTGLGNRRAIPELQAIEHLLKSSRETVD